jgi:hypothetical protein
MLGLGKTPLQPQGRIALLPPLPCLYRLPRVQLLALHRMQGFPSFPRRLTISASAAGQSARGIGVIAAAIARGLAPLLAHRAELVHAPARFRRAALKRAVLQRVVHVAVEGLGDGAAIVGAGDRPIMKSLVEAAAQSLAFARVEDQPRQSVLEREIEFGADGVDARADLLGARAGDLAAEIFL